MTKEDIIKLLEDRIEVYKDLEDEFRQYGNDLSAQEAWSTRRELEDILKEVSK